MDIPTCVLDVGSHAIKGGLGSAAVPSVTVPSLSGSFKYKPVFTTLMQHLDPAGSGVVAGFDVEKHKAVLQLRYPVRHAVVQDWKAVSVMLRQALDRIFGVENGEHVQRKRCYALVEPPFASRVQRKKLVEELLEYAPRGEVHGIFVGVSPLLALYSSGQLTGIGLDVGEGQISTAAAVNGFSVPSAMLRENGGSCGEAVTTHLEALMQTYGTCERSQGSSANGGGWPVLRTGSIADRELIRSIKERHCEISPTALSPTAIAPAPDGLDASLQAATQQHQRYPPQLHRLPDGTELQVGVEAVLAPEVLFTPSLIGCSGSGVADLAFRAVAEADVDARPLLLRHMVVSGGTTLLNGFGTRFLNEMLQRVPRDNKVRVVASAERAFAPWLGAAFLSQLHHFAAEMTVTREEYEESGEPALHRRLFS